MSDAVAIAATPWSAVVILTAIPYRFLQVLFLERLAELGENASHYGRLLGTTANWTIAAFVVSLWGRAVWARACRIATESGTRPGKEALRVPLVAFVSFLLTAALGELLFYATIFTVLGTVLVILFAGLAIGTMELNDEVSLTKPLRLIARYSREVRIELAVALVFFIALVVAVVNLAAAFGIGIWLARGFGGADVSRWRLLLGFGNRTFRYLVLAGAMIAVEPFWIAANVVLVRKTGAAENGDDMRVWLRELRGGER